MIQRTNKYILGNQDIDASLLSLEMIWKGMTDGRINTQIGSNSPVSFLEIIKGTTINYYMDEAEAKPFIHSCSNALLTKKGLIEDLESRTIKITEEIRAFASQLFPEPINAFTLTELNDIIKKIYFLQSECMTYGAVVAFADAYGDITNNMIGIVESREGLEKPVHEYTNVLGMPKQKSLTEAAYIEVCKPYSDIKKLTNTYFWLNQGYVGMGLTEEEILHIRKIKINDEQRDSDTNREEMLKELALSDEELKVFSTSQSMIYMKSLRADSRQFLYVILNRIIDILSLKFDMPSHLIRTMTFSELIEMLSGRQQIPHNLQQRYSHSLIFENKNDYEIIIGEEARNFLKECLFVENTTREEVLKGQVACLGKVIGNVKLVFGPQHNNKVQEGDILVSTATSPQLLPAMARAAAFVTDVGGITSHAAIVAREMKKPCIVGTKIATQILQDGDLVEVNANKGTIRVIVPAISDSSYPRT